MVVEEQARARFLHHVSCEACGSSDANAVYSDGSTYCFSCCTYKGPTKSPWDGKKVEEHPQKRILHIPEDISFEFPSHIVDWLGQYNLSVEDLIKHRIYYSKQRNQVVFVLPHISMHGEIGMIQVRNFNPNTSKYTNLGDREDVMPIYKAKDVPDTLIVVEDIISAICVSKAGFDGLPVLGSTMSLRKVALVKKLGYERIRVWLDSDKASSNISLASKLAMICDDVHSIVTDLDPKCYNADAISAFVARR